MAVTYVFKSLGITWADTSPISVPTINISEVDDIPVATVKPRLSAVASGKGASYLFAGASVLSQLFRGGGGAGNTSG